jgi:hypothetical protein
MPFTSLEAGYTATVVATFATSVKLGGVAFADDGDILATRCLPLGGALIRWDVQGGTTAIGGSTVFADVSEQGSSAGCGMINHSDGHIYSNTFLGLVRLSGTGAQIGDALGGSGNSLGVSEDPVTGDIYWVGDDGTIMALDPATDTVVNPAFVNNGGLTDGIAWSPKGDFLATTNRDLFFIDVFDRAGNLLVSVDLGTEPDGIAFGEAGTMFTNNLDGTISKVVFDDLSDLAGGHTVSVFASGGFAGDLAHVGADGCWYVTQRGTRFEDGTETPDNSIVRICGSGNTTFDIPPGLRRPGGGIVPEPGGLVLAGFALALAAAARRTLTPRPS